MFVTYVLYSKTHDRLYIGFTSNLIQRFYSHQHLSKKGFTVRYRPWKVIEVRFHDKKQEALNDEKFLKSGQGRFFIRNTLLPKFCQLGSLSARGGRQFQPEADRRVWPPLLEKSESSCFRTFFILQPS